MSLVHIFGVYHVVTTPCSAGRSLIGDLADAVPDDAGSVSSRALSFSASGKKFERLKKALDRVRGAALYTASRRAEAPRDTSKTVGNLEKRGSRAASGFTDL